MDAADLIVLLIQYDVAFVGSTAEHHVVACIAGKHRTGHGAGAKVQGNDRRLRGLRGNKIGGNSIGIAGNRAGTAVVDIGSPTGKRRCRSLFRVGTPLVILCAVTAVPEQQEEIANNRNQADKKVPAAVSGIMETADTQGNGRQQDDQRPDTGGFRKKEAQKERNEVDKQGGPPVFTSSGTSAEIGVIGKIQLDRAGETHRRCFGHTRTSISP